MTDIKDVEVYDPKQDGFDYATYKAAYDALNSVNKKAGNVLLWGLVRRVEESKVVFETLRDFLFDKEEGFFESNPRIAGVVFMDGRLHSDYDLDGIIDLVKNDGFDKLGKESNAIPFIFTPYSLSSEAHRAFAVDGYTRKNLPQPAAR